MSLGHDIIQSKTSLTVLCLMLGLVALTSFQSEMRCHPTISSSVISFSSCPQSFPASGSFPMSQFFASDGQSIRWDGWTASPTRWTWVWASSRSWWWKRKPGMLQSMGLQSPMWLSYSNDTHLLLPLITLLDIPWWVQWLRIHLPGQGTQVQSLAWEDHTCWEATKPVYHNY